MPEVTPSNESLACGSGPCRPSLALCERSEGGDGRQGGSQAGSVDGFPEVGARVHSAAASVSRRYATTSRSKTISTPLHHSGTIGAAQAIAERTRC